MGTGKPAAIRTIPAAGPEERGILTLTEEAIQPAWSADGRFLYLSSKRGGTRNIWRVPIDPKKGRGLGPPVPVSVPAASASRPSLSRQGMRLAYESAAWSTQLRKVPFDTMRGVAAGVGEEIWSSSRGLDFGSVSPDGAWLALTQSDPYEDLLLLKLDGSMTRQLTNDRTPDRSPRFSPDGTRVAFFSLRSGRPQIWEMHTDGSGLRHLPLEGLDLCYPVYSPDGARLVGTDEKGSTWRFDLTRSDSAWVPAHKASSSEPLLDGAKSWSRDGRKIAGDLTDQGYRKIGIFVESAETGERRRLTDSGASPVWLSDSRRLLYLDAGAIRLLDTTTGRSSVVLPAARAPREVGYFDVSMDDSFIVVNETSSQSDIWMMTEGAPDP